MTVDELIERLTQLDGDLPVIVEVAGMEWRNVARVVAPVPESNTACVVLGSYCTPEQIDNGAEGSKEGGDR